MVLVRRRLQRVGHWLHNQVHDLLYLSHSERREQRRQRRREREQEVREQRNQYILELLEAQDDERRRAREIEEENEEVQSVLSYESYEEIEGVVTVIVQIAGSISSQVAGEALRRWADDIYDGPAPGEDIRVFLVSINALSDFHIAYCHGGYFRLVGIPLSAGMQPVTLPTSQSYPAVNQQQRAYESHGPSSKTQESASASACPSSSTYTSTMRWPYETIGMSPFFHLVYIYLIQTAFITGTAASPKDIWHVSIWEAPAPPPGKGPPISASALRDPAYLPAQISAIVGAYVFSVLVIGSAILFVGRRLRRAAQASPQSLAMEMMKPVKTEIPNAFDPSPISPAKSATLYGHTPESDIDMRNNWPSPNKSVRNSGWGSISKGHKKQDPSIQSSVVTFDESVIEDDKERNQREMERLYAAVLNHDEEKSASAVNLPDREHPQRYNPPELQHLRTSQQATVNPTSPPPRSDTKSPARAHTKSPRTSSRPTPLSLHSRNSSRSSFGSFSKKRGIRNLPISPPMGSPDLIPDYNDAYGETEPLSPRVYDDPGPPPPTPPQQRAMKSRGDVMDATRLSPQSTRFPEQPFRAPRMPAFPGVQPIPESGRSIGMSQDSSNTTSQRDLTKTRRTPAPLALRTQALNNSNSQRSPLPQNQHQNPLRSAPLPLRQPHPTNYNADLPPSMIKATVLERKVPNHSLRTPATGVPQTPYSPYMPFTPLTPMTPSRLVTREERRRREKEEGRRVATIDDAVEEEPDMWGDAYP